MFSFGTNAAGPTVCDQPGTRTPARAATLSLTAPTRPASRPRPPDRGWSARDRGPDGDSAGVTTVAVTADTSRSMTRQFRVTPSTSGDGGAMIGPQASRPPCTPIDGRQLHDQAHVTIPLATWRSFGQSCRAHPGVHRNTVRIRAAVGHRQWIRVRSRTYPSRATVRLRRR